VGDAVVEVEGGGDGVEDGAHATDVVGVRVAGDHEVEAGDAERAELREHVGVVVAGVVEDRVPCGAEDEHAGALADVEEVELERERDREQEGEGEHVERAHEERRSVRGHA
jgi:hypothetical protein